MAVKLLALDLDGTVVSDLREISKPVEDAIREAIAKDVVVTIATGRELPTTLKFAKRLGITAPIICYQGALIQDLQNNQALKIQHVPAKLSRNIIKFARRNKLPMVLYTPDAHYTELPSPLIQETLRTTKTSLTVVNNLLSVLGKETHPLKFLFIQDLSNIEKVSRQLAAEFGDVFSIVRTHEIIVEAILPDVSKGQALITLAKHLNIPISQTMAIGDQENDVSMIESAGIGVAMGNAVESAKAVADVIAPNVEKDGVAWAIKKYILNTHYDAVAPRA